jgi:hypothetical protein
MGGSQNDALEIVIAPIFIVKCQGVHMRSFQNSCFRVP